MNATASLPYFPRKDFINQVLRGFDSGLKQGFALYAERRQGKTEFIRHELKPAAEARRWAFVLIDLWERSDDPDLAIVEGLEAAAGIGQRSIWTTPLNLKKVTAKGRAGAAELSADFEPSSKDTPAEDLLGRLRKAFDALMKKAKREKVLLVFDEFQTLADPKYEAFVKALRTHIQKYREQLLVMFTGSEQHTLSAMFLEEQQALYSSALMMPLPLLDRDFVDDRVTLLRDAGITVDGDALNRAFTEKSCNPEFINDVVMRILISRNPDITKAINDWYQTQDQKGYGPKLNDMPRINQAVLRFIVSQPTKGVFGKEAIKVIQQLVGAQPVVTKAKIQGAIRTLVNKHYIATMKEPGRYYVLDPSLRQYLSKLMLDAV